jgi:hypothetical protein
VKPLSRAGENRAKHSAATVLPTALDIGESSMTALVQAINRISATPHLETEILKSLAVVGGAFLFVFLLIASYGLDLSPGFF